MGFTARKLHSYSAPLEARFPIDIHGLLDVPSNPSNVSLSLDKMLLVYRDGTERELVFPNDMRSFTRCNFDEGCFANDPPDTYRYLVGETRFDISKARKEGSLYGLAVALRYHPQTGYIDGMARPLINGANDLLKTFLLTFRLTYTPI